MATLSQHHSQLTLETLRTAPEGQYLERKSSAIKPSKLADEIIGMLNASGGTVVVGVSDQGDIEDLAHLSEKSLNALRKVLATYIAPPSDVLLEELTLATGELIFLYHVEIDYERIFQRSDNESIFLRVVDENRGPLSREAVRKLEYNRGVRSFEDEIREDFTTENLSLPICEEYRAKMKYEGTVSELFLKRGLAVRHEDTMRYRNAAVLLFADDPSQFIPSALVRYVKYAGTEGRSGDHFNVVKDERFEGPIPSLIKTVTTFLSASLGDYYFWSSESGRFERISEYPRDAWLEGVVNALCHRSYNIQGNVIYLKHYDDRLEISNSGPLPAQVTVENIQSERYSRNPKIARVLSEMGYVRELNEGVPRIYSAMEGSMLSQPEYQDSNGVVKLTLRNKVAKHQETIHAKVIQRISQHLESCQDTQRFVVNYFFHHPLTTLDELMKGLKLSEATARYHLKKLEELKILERDSEKTRDRKAPYQFAQE